MALEPPELTEDPEDPEDPEYLSSQLITCLGNKRSLLDLVGQGVDLVEARLGLGRKLDILDAFAGSGVVSRYLKSRARFLVSNDFESYARAAAQCYLVNQEDFPSEAYEIAYREALAALEGGRLREGLIARLYAPQDDEAIQAGERVFYTRRNALYLDTARQLIEGLEPGLRPFFLGPLLSEASVHANTSGVFKGFYKNAETGLGKFGGRKGDALTRILGDISLRRPVLSRHSCAWEARQEDANLLAKDLCPLDLAYLDPPYNQHPYGSNYFMLNLLADYREPEAISRVSGIPRDWRRSAYNKAKLAAAALEDLVADLKARFILLSFSSDGFVRDEEILALLGRHGRVDVLEKKYNTFRGSRNLRGRSLYLRERLYVLEKS